MFNSPRHHKKYCLNINEKQVPFLNKEFKRVMVSNATFINIPVVFWLSVLLMEENGVPGEKKKPLTCRKSLTNLIT